ncbi:MAG: hypothetical protein Q7S37_01195 [bacterium]|nr:hypothetical protein [bacterium]
MNDTEQLKDEIYDYILFSQALCKKAKDIINNINVNDPREIKNKLDYANNTNIYFLKLVANLFISQCIIELGTLLDKKDARQKSLYQLITVDEYKTKPKIIDYLNQIHSNFGAKRLWAIRHQFVAHHSKNSKGGPTSIIFSTYKGEYIQSCEDIIEEIINFWKEHIGYGPGNNMFIDKLESVDGIADQLIKTAKNPRESRN